MLISSRDSLSICGRLCRLEKRLKHFYCLSRTWLNYFGGDLKNAAQMEFNSTCRNFSRINFEISLEFKSFIRVTFENESPLCKLKNLK